MTKQFFIIAILALTGAAPLAAQTTPDAQIAELRKLMVKVDCNVDRMVVAGKYDWVDDDITQKNFPEAGCKAGQAELHLVHLNRELTTKQILGELDRRDLRPATLPELLALGTSFPELQRKFWIVALGSQWQDPDGYGGVPVLRVAHGGKRDLTLVWDDPDGPWYVFCRFLAVRK